MKTNHLKIFSGILILLGSAVCAVGQTAPKPKVSAQAARIAPLFKSGKFQDAKGGAMPYRYFEPPAGTTPGAKNPVILYLHGEEEAGVDNNAQITTTECATVWAEPAHVAAHPSFVIAPQIAKGADWTAEPAYSATLALLAQFIKDHPAADANRVYIVGFSQGATGLWNMLLKNPKLFAAAMPISGSADKYLGDYQAWAALKNTPVIIIHAYDDTVVPVGAALSAAAALQAAGNQFLGYGAPTPCLWSPGSTPAPHDAWWTAFHKFEVVYNSLFWGDLAATHNGEIDPTTLYTKKSHGNGITEVWDYALGTAFVIERPEKAIIIDTTMGHGSIYQFIKNNVLSNKNIDLEIFFSHQHNDHVLGLPSFAGAAQLKKVYVHALDAAPVKALLGADAGKLVLVKDGDQIPFGGKNAEVIAVPGHTLGSIVLKYENYLFAGDSIGTGYVGVGQILVEQYVQEVQHLLDKMGAGKYIVYGGHTGENYGTISEKYVTDLLRCAKGMVANTLPAPVYWRGGDTTARRVSTVGGSSITYALTNVRRVPGALRNLQINPAALYQGYEPQFAQPAGAPPTRAAGFVPSITYYYASVAATVDAISVTPTAMDADYKSIAVNGAAVRSGDAYKASLNPGMNRIGVAVTAANGAARTYTIDVFRSAR